MHDLQEARYHSGFTSLRSSVMERTLVINKVCPPKSVKIAASTISRRKLQTVYTSRPKKPCNMARKMEIGRFVMHAA